MTFSDQTNSIHLKLFKMWWLFYCVNFGVCTVVFCSGGTKSYTVSPQIMKTWTHYVNIPGPAGSISWRTHNYTTPVHRFTQIFIWTWVLNSQLNVPFFTSQYQQQQQQQRLITSTYMVLNRRPILLLYKPFSKICRIKRKKIINSSLNLL